MNKEPMELTMNEICKYISIVNKLCKTGIMTFDLEKCRATVQVNTLTEYLEKQNVELQQRIDKAIEYIKQLLSDEYGVSIYVDEYSCEYEPEWKDKLLKILKGEPNNEN